MFGDRTGCGHVIGTALFIATGCTSVDTHWQDSAQAAGSLGVDSVGLQPSTAEVDQSVGSATVSVPDGNASQPPSAELRMFAAGAAVPSVRPPLPGRSARTVLNEELNEAENLFFTDDGRLFVSGGEDIYEIQRAPDGTFTKTDHFDEDCLVEGIVRSGQYLYGVCTLNNDDNQASFLIAGELSAQPVFRTIAPLAAGSIPNGMTVDPEGRIYITESVSQQIVRVTLASPLQVQLTEVWAADILFVNGIKYLDHALYVTMLDATLVSRFLRIPVLSDGSAGTPELLYSRVLTVLDDILPFDGGFIITDFLKGTLIFWDERRGAYAETPTQTFYGPTSLAQGQPPMFNERQLIVAEKGIYLVRDERDGDLLSMYQLP